MTRIVFAIIAVVVVSVCIRVYAHNYEECRRFGHTKLYCLTGAK